MSRDIRAYARQTNIRLAIGALLLLFLVGVPLIYVIYGKEAALSSLLCMFIALIPVFLIGLIFWALGKWVERINREDG